MIVGDTGGDSKQDIVGEGVNGVVSKMMSIEHDANEKCFNNLTRTGDRREASNGNLGRGDGK